MSRKRPLVELRDEGRRLPPLVDYDAMVADLAVPHRRKNAKWKLFAAGFAASAAVRRGLHSEDPTVRRACCEILDHFLDEAAIPDLLHNLGHPDPKVRGWAVHALACDRCKEGACRPGESESLPLAITMLLDDPSPEARYQALGLVAAAVHRSADALAAVTLAHEADPHPGIRKAAGWWVPGGVRYEKTKPKSPRAG